MRLISTLLLTFLILPAHAQEMSEAERLKWWAYELAVAESPGDVYSDQLMARMLSKMQSPPDAAAPESASIRALRARAQVVSAELQANVAAARDTDPFLLGADLGCWPKGKDPETCSARRAKLEALVGDNAYHALVLMTYAWAADDADGFLRAARLAADATDYQGALETMFHSLRERYRQVPPPAMPGMTELDRLYAPEVMAMAVYSAIAIPPLQNFSQPCRESEGELREHCLALAIKMVQRGQMLIDAYIAKSVVDALGSPEQVEMAASRHRRLEWLQARAMPLLAATEQGRVAGMDAYLDALGRDGEIAAMQALLRAHNIALDSPEGWTKSAAVPGEGR